MGFTRSFSDVQIEKMTNGENSQLFAQLKADVLAGDVFPAVRINELHFYYKGGCLYKFSGFGFKRDKNYKKFGVGFETLSPYGKAKKENELKYRKASGGQAERQLLDGLYRHTFAEHSSSIVVLDIEVNLGGQAVRKCDLVLLNTLTDEIMFVEGKVFSDRRVKTSIPSVPEVIEQVNGYSNAIRSQEQTILEQYARHIDIVNGLFGSSFRPPKKLVQPAKLLVYNTPEKLTINGEHSIGKIDSGLGAGNVLWVAPCSSPTLSDIWNGLSSK